VNRWALFAVAAAMAVAAANFLLNLGSSSLFVDEVYSLGDASVPLGSLMDRLRDTEVTPPAYFVALHEWIGRLGAEAEWEVRLPSTICAICLIPALFDLGRIVAGTSAGVVAAALGALSPLVLDYAQQVRTYAPAMLVIALAATCALRAVDGRPEARRWAIGAGLLVALGFSMHYTTLLATGPLLALIVLTGSLSRRVRAATLAPVAVVVLALLPLMLDQLESGRQAAISPFSEPTVRNLLSIFGTPWDSRLAEPVVYKVVAALITTGAIVWMLARGSTQARVIALGASGPVIGSIVATLVSDDAIITRYTSISAPFALVAIGAAVASFGGVRRAVAIAVVLFIGFSGTLRGHDRDARFADARAATEAIESRWRPGDVIVTPANNVTVNLPMLHYAGLELPPGADVVPGEDAEGVEQLLAQRSRLWIVFQRVPADAAAGLERRGYRTEMIDRYRGTVPITLWLATPER